MPPSIITLENSQFDFSKALVIIISQSGLSADLVECENKSKQMGGTTILISNNHKSSMVNTSNFFYYINAGEEKSVAATKTFVLSLLIIQKIIFNTLNKNINNHIENISEELIEDSNNQWDAKILNKSVDVRRALAAGQYSNLTVFYDSLEQKFSKIEYKMGKEVQSESTLGGDDENDEEKMPTPKGLEDHTSRLYTRISDHGALGVGELGLEASGRDPVDQAKAISRYNALFSQSLNIQVPCNTNLKIVYYITYF